MSPSAIEQAAEVADDQVLDHVGDDDLLGDRPERRQVGDEQQQHPGRERELAPDGNRLPRPASVAARLTYAKETAISSSGAATSTIVPTGRI